MASLHAGAEWRAKYAITDPRRLATLAERAQSSDLRDPVIG